MKIVKRSILAIGLIGLSVGAYAVPSTSGLYLVDDTSGASVFVGLTGGGASYSGSVGTWTVSLTTGTTLVGGVDPAINLNIGSAVAGIHTSGALEVIYSDVGFGPTSGSATLATGVGYASGHVSSTAGFDTGNNAFGQESNLTGGVGPLHGFLTGGLATGGLNSGGSQYSLTIADTITAAPGGAAIMVDTILAVTSPGISSTIPDSGMTLVLLGMGLTGLFLFARFRKQVEI